MALQERIEQERQENPLLELREADPDLPAETEAEDHEPPDAPTDDERELVIGEKDGNEDDFERLMNMDVEWPDHSEERSRPSRNQRCLLVACRSPFSLLGESGELLVGHSSRSCVLRTAKMTAKIAGEPPIWR